MWRIVKLIIYFYLYQVLFTALVTLPEIWTQLMNNGGHTDGFTGVKIIITATCLALVLSDITMIWHLIRFKYVKFNLKSFGEVSGKTMVLSIVWVVASMMFANLCCEFLNLPDYTQATAYAMSRNVLGILSITIMAPLVEELLFRGAIQGHLMRIGVKPLFAILASSAIFGIIHMNPAQILFAFAIGLIFGWLYYRTGSLVPGIVGHFINNSIACIQMAVMTQEEINTKTIEWLGEGPTYALFALSFVGMLGMFLYLNKHLPAAPVYTENQERILKFKEETIMRKIDFQTKASANRNKNKEEEYIRGAADIGFVFLVGKILEIYYRFQGGGFKSDDIALKICELIIMVICTVLIGFIAYNIKRKQVFIKANARLVQLIGWVVVVSSIVTPMISMHFDDTHYVVVYPIQYLMQLGFFIVAIGYVFQLAIKIKEEQDLTI